MRFRILSVILVLLGSGVYAQQIRDVRPAAVVGRGAISGVVVTAGSNPQPLRGAHVSLTGAELLGQRTVITDESGVFRFTGLPAGRLGLTATKPAYLSAAYQSKRPGGPGVSIALADGQVLRDITLTLHKGGVITGRVVDERGRPQPDTQVSAGRLSWITGERQPVGAGSATTDDRGLYRIFGLMPGEYVIQAQVPVGGGGAIRKLTPAEIDAGLDPRRPTQSPEAASGQTFGSSPFYFPNTPRRENATLVSVSTAEERTGIDITVRLVPTARISGAITGLPAGATSRVSVTLYGESLGSGGRFAQPTGSGNEPRGFQIAGMTPGHYVISARTAPAAPGAAEPTMWALSEIDVNGRDVGVSLALQPGLTISGRVVFENPVTPPAYRDWFVNVAAMTNTSALRPDGPATVSADGTFTIQGLPAGHYRLRAGALMPDASRTGTWDVKSAMVGSTDAVDVPIEITASATDVVITMTRDKTELSGRLQTATGAAAPDYFVIVFPTNRTQWTNFSRYIKTTRPGSDGSFRFTSLPAGEYHLAALTDVEQGEWLSPAFLERLVASATRFTLTSGEKKVQDIQIAK